MDGQAGLKRAFGQHAAEHLQFEEDFLVVFGDVAGGLQAIVDHLDPVVVRSKKRQWDRLSASYGFNATGLKWPTNNLSAPMSYKLSQIANPGRTAFIVSATNYQVTYGGRFLWKSSPVEGKTTTDKIACRHGNKAIVIYYDGSTGFITLADLAAIDGKGGVANAFWKATP